MYLSKIITAPTDEPTTIEEAKDQCRIDSTGFDDLLQTYIPAARQWVESYTNRKLITQTWEIYLRRFCDLELPFPPLQSVEGIWYYDETNTEQQLATSVYEVTENGTDPRILMLAYGQSWPGLYQRSDAVRIRMDVGYGDQEDVPGAIKTAMLFWIQARIDNDPNTMATYMKTAKDSLFPFKVHSFG